MIFKLWRMLSQPFLQHDLQHKFRLDTAILKCLDNGPYGYHSYILIQCDDDVITVFGVWVIEWVVDITWWIVYVGLNRYFSSSPIVPYHFIRKHIPLYYFSESSNSSNYCKLPSICSLIANLFLRYAWSFKYMSRMFYGKTSGSRRLNNFLLGSFKILNYGHFCRIQTSSYYLNYSS